MPQQWSQQLFRNRQRPTPECSPRSLYEQLAMSEIFHSSPRLLQVLWHAHLNTISQFTRSVARDQFRGMSLQCSQCYHCNFITAATCNTIPIFPIQVVGSTLGCSLLVTVTRRGCYLQSDEATVLSKAVKARWCPLCTTVTLLFGCYQTSFGICSSSLASLITQ